MAKGQLHSTGTICKAERKCPLEGDGESHFDTVDQLIDHTASETGASVNEIRDIIGSGVKLAEAVSMAREGLIGSSVPSSHSTAPGVPATIEIDLSSASSSALSEKFLENLREMYPVSSVTDDGDGRLTVIVDAESDPDDYSVLMAADTAARNAASEMGYDEDEMEEFEESFTVEAKMDTESLSAPDVAAPPATVVVNAGKAEKPASFTVDLSEVSADVQKKFAESYGSLSGLKVMSYTNDNGKLSFELEGSGANEGDVVDGAVNTLSESLPRIEAESDEAYDALNEEREALFERVVPLDGSANNIRFSATQSVSWSYEGNEFTSSGLTEEETIAKQNELRAEGIESSVS